MCRGLAGTERERERERQTRGPWPVGCLEFYCHHARKSEVGTGHLGAWIKQRGREHRPGRPGRGSGSQEGGAGPPPLKYGATDDLHGAYRSANKSPTRILPLSSLSFLPPLLRQTPKTVSPLAKCFLETPNHSPQQVPRQSHNSTVI